jgi:hypothetical protein
MYIGVYVPRLIVLLILQHLILEEEEEEEKICRSNSVATMVDYSGLDHLV